MILKVSTIKSADVLTKEGAKLDTVKDILYDPSQKRIIGFLTSRKSVMSEVKVIPYDHVQKFSQQVLMVDSQDSEKTIVELGTPYTQLVQDEGMMLKKATIVDEDAQKYGDISDVFFETETGEVKGFELSNGPLQDAKEGKNTMEISEIISVGRDAVIVRPVFPSDNAKPADKPQETVHNALQQKISSLPGEMMKTFSNTAQKATQKVKEQAGEVSSSSNPPLSRKPARSVKKTVSQGSQQHRTPHRTSPAPEPQSEPAEESQPVQQSPQVTQPQEARPQLSSQSPQPVSAKPVQQQKQSDQRQGGNSDSPPPVEEPSKEPDPQKVQEAIGKYVSKNILTPSDQILAKRGQIITHQLMQNAYTAGVVDEVLANTSPTPL